MAQQPEIFTVEDFDLKGNVKSCLVVTKYGKEEYEFDKNGRLTKSTTRYNDTDYDVTYYKIAEDALVEKRTEHYRDGEFDPSTSIANFYEVNAQGPKKITEKIFSYDEDFLDCYEYIYDDSGKLIKIIRLAEGEDETAITYEGDNKNFIKTFTLNETIQKTVKTTTDTLTDTRTVHTTNYLDGNPSWSIKEVFTKEGKLLSQIELSYKTDLKKFIEEESKAYEYDEQGMLIKLTTKKGNLERVQEYIYQYDSGDSGNWVKQIITPDNLYTTRRIKYYPGEKVAEKQE